MAPWLHANAQTHAHIAEIEMQWELSHEPRKPASFPSTHRRDPSMALIRHAKVMPEIDLL